MTLQEMRKTIARRIEDFRKKLGLSQKQLAERVDDLTASAIEKFEKAEIAPSPQTLSRLAEALNVMNDDLIRPYVIDIDYRKVRYRKRSKMPKKQVEAVQLLKEQGIFDGLPEGLKEAGNARIENPESSLKELSELLGVGRSGINHRLRRLEQLAKECKGDHEA